jgi:hypothetical protein
MGKVLIVLNAVGLLLNAVVFIIVVDLSGGLEGVVDATSAPSKPALSREDVERLLEEKLTKINSGVASTLTSKLQSLTQDLKSVSAAVKGLERQLHTLAAEPEAPPAAATPPARVPDHVPDEAPADNGGNPPPGTPPTVEQPAVPPEGDGQAQPEGGQEAP